ncbi:MAG: RidA family protein [Pseudonocardiaceae bacterium]
MDRELLSSAKLFSGVPYHYAAIARGDALVLTAGACPLDSAGCVVGHGDIRHQMRQALENLQVTLEQAACAIEDVLKTSVFVASTAREDLSAAWDEYELLFGTDGPPSTLLGVTVLGWPDQLVEVEAIALRRCPE